MALHCVHRREQGPIDRHETHSRPPETQRRASPAPRRSRKRIAPSGRRPERAVQTPDADSFPPRQRTSGPRGSTLRSRRSSNRIGTLGMPGTEKASARIVCAPTAGVPYRTPRKGRRSRASTFVRHAGDRAVWAGAQSCGTLARSRGPRQLPRRTSCSNSLESSAIAWLEGIMLASTSGVGRSSHGTGQERKDQSRWPAAGDRGRAAG